MKTPLVNGSSLHRAGIADFRRLVVVLGSTAILLASGCSTLSPISKTTAPTEMAAPPETNRGPTYKVLLAGYTSSEPKVFTGTLTKPITVSQALEESGATQKYDGMRVDLARRVAENGEVLRLEIPWDSEAGTITDEHFNYAVHPGDEILVRPASSGPMHKMFKALGSGE